MATNGLAVLELQIYKALLQIGKCRKISKLLRIPVFCESKNCIVLFLQ